MKRRIDECKWLSPKGPFWYGEGTDPTPFAQAVDERMQSIGHRAAIGDCRPHRLRDTLAVQDVAVTLLVEPHSFVHANTGITPRKEIGMRREWVPSALSSIAPTFRFGPVLTDPQEDSHAHPQRYPRRAELGSPLEHQ
jgi:hypothetical protein